MRIGCALIAYDDPRFVREAIVPFNTFMKTAAFLGERPWGHKNAPITKSVNQFNNLVANLVDDTIVDYWETEADQRNAAMEYMRQQGFDYVWMLDADEIFAPRTIPKILACVLQNPATDVFFVRHNVYWKTPEYRVELDCDYKGLTVVKANVPFTTLRNFDDNKYSAKVFPYSTDAICEHMSYVRTDEEMERKLKFFSHNHEVREGWFENVWKAWKPEDTNIHPCRAEMFKRAVDINSVPADHKSWHPAQMESAA